MSTKTWSDEVIVYGSKNSILVDTINYTNEFNKENEQKAKEKEEQDAMTREQAKAMLKMLADSNVKNESIDEKVHPLKKPS
jgi:Zn-dependent peptidase ImmA (M78 family)